TQLTRTGSGGGRMRGQSQALELLQIAARWTSSRAPDRPLNRNRSKPIVGLQVRKAHLDPLPLSRDLRRPSSLLMGTFRQWLMVNAGAPMVGNQRPPDATILQPTVAVSAAGNRGDFQVCAADLDLVGRPDQRFDASSLAILALVETGPSCLCHRRCCLCTLQGRKGTLGCR